MQWSFRILILIAAPIACSAGMLFIVFGIWGLDRGALDSWVLLLLGVGILVGGVALLMFAFRRLKKMR